MKKKFIFLYLIFAYNSLPAKTQLDQVRRKREIDTQRQLAVEALPNKVGKPKKLIKNMDFDEACHARSYYDIMDEPELVIKCLDRIVATAKDPEALKKARLDLAHAYEAEKKDDKALKAYEEFVKLYPGSTECEEAHYKIIKINFATSNDHLHDQTKTLEIVDLAKKFLEPENNHIIYKKEVEQALRNCYEKLCDHDIYISRQYLTQFSYSEEKRDLNAAKHRIKHCKNKYLPYAPSKQEAVDAVYKKIETYEPPIDQENDENNAQQQEQNETDLNDVQKAEPTTPSKFL